MADLVLFADAEELLIDYLAAALADRAGYEALTVSSTVPNPRPVESVVLFRTGGPRRDMVTDTAQITVEARAGAETRAVTVIGVIRALINDAYGRDLAGYAVHDVEELSGPANLPDPVGSQYRYSQTFLVSIRGLSTA